MFVNNNNNDNTFLLCGLVAGSYATNTSRFATEPSLMAEQNIYRSLRAFVLIFSKSLIMHSYTKKVD